jgi:hypothetical protein
LHDLFDFAAEKLTELEVGAKMSGALAECSVIPLAHAM